jgi:hypothetical protein
MHRRACTLSAKRPPVDRPSVYPIEGAAGQEKKGIRFC